MHVNVKLCKPCEMRIHPEGIVTALFPFVSMHTSHTSPSETILNPASVTTCDAVNKDIPVAVAMILGGAAFTFCGMKIRMNIIRKMRIEKRISTTPFFLDIIRENAYRRQYCKEDDDLRNIDNRGVDQCIRICQRCE